MKQTGRTTVEIEGDFVVFLIGMRINKPWKIHKWFPVAMAMPKMLRELAKDPNSGFLGARQGATFLVQYWRSFEHLSNYARNKDATHYPEWVKFNKRVGQRGDVGIWHETFLVREGQYEAIYNNMPRAGLAKFGTVVPAKGRHGSSRSRLGIVPADDAPITPEGELVGGK